RPGGDFCQPVVIRPCRPSTSASARESPAVGDSEPNWPAVDAAKTVYGDIQFRLALLDLCAVIDPVNMNSYINSSSNYMRETSDISKRIGVVLSSEVQRHGLPSEVFETVLSKISNSTAATAMALQSEDQTGFVEVCRSLPIMLAEH